MIKNYMWVHVFIAINHWWKYYQFIVMSVLYIIVNIITMNWKVYSLHIGPQTRENSQGNKENKPHTDCLDPDLQK
jgi:hypothetical protein